MSLENVKQEEQEIEVNAGLDNLGLRAELHSEADLTDHHDHELEEAEIEKVDYTTFSKKQLALAVKDLSKEDNFKKVDALLKEIKPLFDDIREKEKAEAKSRFIAEGGAEDDFDYKGDEFDTLFEANYRLIRDRRNAYYRQQEESKQNNLAQKLELLEKLRQLVDSPEGAQFESVKEIQKQWKSIGVVPLAQAKTLWANYHALIDRFYDNQSIYFELKELDRKKNLELKMELCVRAEKLQGVPRIKDAVRELNELHHEFKHIGPVPMEEKESVWQRFKAASDAIYTRRDEYLKNLQVELQSNLEKKTALAEEASAYASFNTDRIKEWNQKSKEILDLQKRWEAIGGLPRSKSKEVNRKFWSSFKSFFSAKNQFFKKLDEERSTNLEQKQELVKRAQELKDSSDWDKAANELKSLQAKWKDIGPVPEKVREKIFKEFKEACDFFFDQKRQQADKAELDQVENLKAKEAVCAELLAAAEQGNAQIDQLHQLQERFNAIGFVPKKDIGRIKNLHTEAVEKFVKSIAALTEEDKSKVLLEVQLSDLRKDPMGDRKIFQKEQTIRKKIMQVENDIALWKNNLEFFARSKNADSLRTEFNEKINAANEHLKQLKQQLKMLRTI